jgi:hypothetical protein
MNIEPGHLSTLQALGYTEAEARFLYIVATHSGYFRARQFHGFHHAHWGKRTTVFRNKLERQKHARTERFPKTGTIYHLFSRRLYRLIDKENLRNRRAHELDFIKRRIAILDFVLANQGYEYLETEPQKVSHFCEKLAVDKRYLPARLYLGRHTPRSSVRYFVDKFPMFLAGPSPVVTFTYLNEATDGFSDFVHHLETYLPLFRQLSEFRLLYVSATDAHFEKATEIFKSLVAIPLESDIADDVLRYFHIRNAWEDKQYLTITDAELIFRTEARARFQGEIFEGLYRGWKMGLVSPEKTRHGFGTNDRKPSIAFVTYKLCPLPVPGEERMEVK